MLYVGNKGIVYPNDSGGFYPRDVKDEDRLEYYASHFDVMLVSSTYFSTLKREKYQEWLAAVKNPNFRFVITLPHEFTQTSSREIKKAWNIFWNGEDGKGGCHILKDKIGCLLADYPFDLGFNAKTFKILTTQLEILPKDISVAFEFKTASWWTEKALKDIDHLFQSEPGTRRCMVYPYLENRVVRAGWAGDMNSTSFKSPTPPPMGLGNFTVMKFYGTLGEGLGSYDTEERLEKIVQLIETRMDLGHDVYCIFCNTDTTFCKPLPPVPHINGIIWPTLFQLPIYSDSDKPCCLHDSIRIKELWKNRRLRVDEDGFVRVVLR